MAQTPFTETADPPRLSLGHRPANAIDLLYPTRDPIRMASAPGNALPEEHDPLSMVLSPVHDACERYRRVSSVGHNVHDLCTPIASSCPSHSLTGELLTTEEITSLREFSEEVTSPQTSTIQGFGSQNFLGLEGSCLLQDDPAYPSIISRSMPIPVPKLRSSSSHDVTASMGGTASFSGRDVNGGSPSKSQSHVRGGMSSPTSSSSTFKVVSPTRNGPLGTSPTNGGLLGTSPNINGSLGASPLVSNFGSAGWKSEFKPAQAETNQELSSTPPASQTAATVTTPPHTPAVTPTKDRTSRTGLSNSQSSNLAGENASQSFFEYLRAEAIPAGKMPSTDVVWGQTERDRVYNFLLYVPYQLERLIQFGLLLCLDSLLGTLVMLPLRSIWSAAIMLKACLTSRKKEGCSKNLSGGRLFDVLTFMLLLSAGIILRLVKPGIIYYWLKEMTNEFLKMGILLAAFEISDKILGNFGLDVLESLSGTCMLYSLGQCHAVQVVSDTVITLVIVVLHGLTLMCEGLVLAVALNSKRHGILALLIASNFAEIKGVVFKRWDIPRIWTLVQADIVERFHWMAIMFFVLVEDMDSSGSWQPSSSVLWECARILASEVVIDVLKHAVLGKFNDVRPGIYREFMKDLCDKVRSTQSHELHKLCGLHHLAVSALIVRTLVTLFRMNLEPGWMQFLTRASLALGVWTALLVFKPVFGFILQVAANNYVMFYNQRFQKTTHHQHLRVGGPPVTPKSAGGAMHVAQPAPMSTQLGWRAPTQSRVSQSHTKEE